MNNARAERRSVGDVLREGTTFLARTNAETPFLDASLLLAYALNLSRERLFSSLPEPVPEKAFRDFRALLERRAAGIPVSYLRNKKEFFGLEFFVDERVLVPRPDTETLVEEALELVRTEPGITRVLDLGTGSGCIAVTLQREAPALDVTGSDISAAAGEVFRINAVKLLGKPLPFLQSDLFENINGIFDLIVSNPPYIAETEVKSMKKNGWPEPVSALDGGGDGTDLPLLLIDKAGMNLTAGGYLALEASPLQMKKLVHEIEKQDYINIMIRKDLAGRDRVIRGRKSYV